MIRLTRIDYDGNKKPITIDAESIESIEEGEKHTELTTKRGWTIYIAESQSEVARKVLLCCRYKEVHRTACRELESEEERETFHKLLELAGLEEPNND